jgi:hypothetical protein
VGRGRAFESLGIGEGRQEHTVARGEVSIAVLEKPFGARLELCDFLVG